MFFQEGLNCWTIAQLGTKTLVENNKVYVKVTLFPGIVATVTRLADTVVCGGVEMRGLATRRAPARKTQEDPVLEEMVFVPYVEEGSDSLVSANLQNYCQICVDEVKLLLKKMQGLGLIKPTEDLLSGCNEVSKDDNKKQQQNMKELKKSKKSVLLQTLLKINSVEPNEKFMSNVKNILSAFKKDLMNDMLLSNHLQARSLKPCVDVVVENSTGHIKVLEVQVAESGLYKSVMNSLKVSPGLHYSYTVATSAKTPIQPDLTDLGMDTFVWDIQDKYLQDQEYDLVVISDILHEQENAEKALKNLHQSVKEGGFLLVTEITHNDILPKSLDILNSVSKDPVHESQYKKEKEWENLFEKSGFHSIARKSDGLLMTTFLLRKKGEDLDDRVVSVDGSHSSWLSRLKQEMEDIQEKSKGTNLWLTTDTSKPSGIVGLVNCLRKEPGGERVR